MNKPLDSTTLAPAAGREQWQRDYAAQIGDDRACENRSGIAIKPLFTREDWDGAREEADLGYPGQPDHPEVVKTIQEVSRRIRQAGRTMQADVMQAAWVSDMLLDAGRRILSSERAI